MSKKIDLKTIIVAILNIVICLCLTIFASPKKVPLFFDLNEKIAVLCSKWFLIVCAIIPTILALFICITQKKQSLNFFLKMLFYVCIYENFLIMTYVSQTDVFEIGKITEIPMSLVYFLPLTACMTIGAVKIKFLPYKAFSPFKNKYSTASEFVWKQTHIYARNVLFAAGFISTVATLILSIFHLSIINFFVIIVAIAITYILVIRESKLMSDKHNDMQKRKDKVFKTIK